MPTRPLLALRPRPPPFEFVLLVTEYLYAFVELSCNEPCGYAALLLAMINPFAEISCLIFRQNLVSTAVDFALVARLKLCLFAGAVDSFDINSPFI